MRGQSEHPRGLQPSRDRITVPSGLVTTGLRKTNDRDAGTTSAQARHSRALVFLCRGVAYGSASISIFMTGSVQPCTSGSKSRRPLIPG